MFEERKASSFDVNQPVHFCNRHTGESRLEKSEAHRNLESILLEDKGYNDKVAFIRNVDMHCLFLNIVNEDEILNNWNVDIQLHEYLPDLWRVYVH